MATLTEKPWLSPGVPSSSRSPARALRTGVYFLFGVITSMFMLFFLAMIIRSQLGDWQPLTEAPWQPLFDSMPLWRNTAYLLMSSLLLHGALLSGRHHAEVLLKGCLVLAGLAALAFLFGQWQVWQSFASRGYGVNSTPAASFFFLLTGLHAAHLLVGLAIWGGALPRLWRHASATTLNRLTLLAQYWHFLLALWLVLFALLTSSPATYQALAALCGVQPIEGP
ncbi:cytochrome c oxidase subunit 3 [Ferrimonas balearica]|uniref:cytochrome c oxidase subunit 3 n=1 Tax=Ferrimonas balearica TaxID=44012 RepID=UPI001C56F47A|nr:cytochrome c oxidase subunit 3 [Ferrimonas balearica]MBY6016728.1 cytochrome c oxidase subunit 3 [Halomonas denitrificans]MBW3139152.1 cytochrome c oxidase subunit 3 [Ferrimonas balearica]MBW3163255.1 cytochrome c oxidase subunit 3 [Ferrimonas balearica]MBY6094979.1 cytochrome c oxidase subunit 3 [Ferrimonas balearica]MBY6223203.1 cytochrome c oxidase subunit 3 [Ferrimonas balearica]